MKRNDDGMAFMLKYENVAWYDKGKVRILDRRVYPYEVRFEECETYGEVACAIRDMVTQSAGPYTAAGMGMALAAHEAENMREKEKKEFLEKAAYTISNARPTTANRMKIVTDGCLLAADRAMEEGEDVSKAIFNRTLESLERRYKTMSKVGGFLEELFPDNGTILTQCFGETIIGTMLRACREKGKDIKLICTETRPYLQGARLTASCAQDMGFDTTVITDNMVAWAMENRGIDVFTSAADTIAEDGYIANKIGTYQISVIAKYFKIPYFVTGIPDKGKTGDNIVIEMRNPEDVLHCGNRKTVMEGVKGIYPSFDITPPHLVSGIVTDRGVYTPYSLSSYFKKGETDFY